MTKRFSDRVKETTTTTGTGNITLAGAVAQYQAFSTDYISNDLIYYSIVGQTGTEWEVGLGTFTSPSTLARTLVLASSNSNTAVNLSSGTKDVFNTIPADYMNMVPTMGESYALAAGNFIGF